MDVIGLLSADQVLSMLEAGSYLLLFLLLFACGLGLPLPEDIPLLAAGTLIARGRMELLPASICAWCGIIGGDCVLYLLAQRYGMNITRIPLIGRHVTRERIERAERLFEQYGVWVVAVGRLFAGIRGAMVVAAGATRFNFYKFIVTDGLAALISGGLFLWLGHVFGKNLEVLAEKVKAGERWVFAVLIIAGVLAVIYVWWRRRKRQALTDAALNKAVHVAQRRAPVTNTEAGAATGCDDSAAAPVDSSSAQPESISPTRL